MKRLAVVLVLILAGCGSAAKAATTTTTTTERPTTTTLAQETALDALKRQIQEVSENQSGRAYAEIVPQQQALFTEAQYDCSLAQQPTSLSVEGVTLVTQYDETQTIPGTSVKVDSTALTVKIKANGQTQTTTFHEIRQPDGSWRFSVTTPSDVTTCTA